MWLWVSYWSFWPLALVQQALAALFFVVRGPCGHFPFCALGLTRRSSRPAYCGRLILFVSQLKYPFMQASLYSSVSPFSKVSPLGFGRCSGLRLQPLREFQAILPPRARLACAGSSFFGSVWRVRRDPSGTVGSNPAVKPTRLRRAAYFVR